jgi:hypothetical protein
MSNVHRDLLEPLTQSELDMLAPLFDSSVNAADLNDHHLRVNKFAIEYIEVRAGTTSHLSPDFAFSVY